ncbi:MAG: S8 family serine peptidase [Acidobacteriota bacterium]
MKRTTLFVIIVVGALFLSGTTALMQQEPSQNLSSVADVMAQGYMNTGAFHKVIIGAEETQIYNELLARNAITDEINYGSFKLVVVNEQAVGGRDALQQLTTTSDEQNLIALNGFVLDTTNPETTYKQLPANLRQTKMAEAMARGINADSGLYLIQFAGPVQDAWLETLKGTGAEIVSYMSNNAYVVRADFNAAASLPFYKSQNGYVQFVGDYEPAYRVSPSLRAAMSASDKEVPVTVQVIDGTDAESTVKTLANLAREFVGSRQVMNYHNVALTITADQIEAIARLDNVFGIEERGQIRRLDEAQGQIVAGNLTGNLPSAPGYLSWLAGKGFTSSQFTTFAVNVVDDATSLTGHPDLATSRVAFTNNPTSQTGAQGGHGFLNAHIIGGINSGTGSAVEDANGYDYGLGIAPFARVGSTAIFGGGTSSPTTWENTAYGQSARISSNSWGFQTQTGGPVADYDANSQEYDRIVRDAQSGTTGNQQLTVVFAAGNDGSGANTVSSPATAKNVITVGASENVRQTGTDGCGIGNTGADSANDIISFSSRGPVNSTGGDGRVKPDIVAPGTHIEAGVPQSNYNGSSVCNQYWPTGQTLYGWSSGTSHSCPAVAGGATLVYQDFLNKGLAAPSPAMVKAALMNSAAYMTGTGAGGNLPSNSQGMGRMDLGRSFDSSQRILVDQTQVLGATGNTYQITGSVVSTSQPLRITLAWTDAAGPTTGAPWVNNLDLEVTVGATTYKGNVFSGANSVSGGTADGKNNVESVFLPAGTSGNFTVTVRATNIAGDGVPGNADTTDQDFALVIYNATTGGSPSPTIGVSPSSLSFTATAGGANPANQSLSITNTGGGTLNWTASSNQTWLSVSPTSGTAPSTATVSVNITGLAAGTYNGAITISATGATNTPLSVPVTLTVNPSGGGCTGELIVNGGFESGTTPWVLSGAVRSTGAYPHSGIAYSILGGVNRATHTEYQAITIPAGCSKNLSFWLNVTSSETTTTTQFDRLFIEVRSTSGTLLGTLATFSNLNKGTAGVYVLRGPYSLASWAGQTVRIQFRATTDGSLITSFRVDDVTVQ